MNFQPKLAVLVMAGEKTVTRRLVSTNPRSPWWRERCAYRVGQDVAICPGRGKHAICRARVVSVGQIPLGMISQAEAAREGFASADQFIIAWTAINGAYRTQDLVWRIELEALS